MKVAFVLLIAATLFLPPVRAQTGPAARCAASKIKATSKKTSAKLKCHAAAAPSEAVPIPPA